MKIIYEYTKDGLKLPGAFFESEVKNICVVCIHGMSTSILEDNFASIWGDLLSSNDIGFLYGHTRGYSKINSIPLKDGGFKCCGSSYEVFDESDYDVDLWVNSAKELGYEKIVLLGHSYGALKVIYYLSRHRGVDGVILASAPDIQGLAHSKIPYYDYFLDEALKNINDGKGDKLLKEPLGPGNYISSLTYYTCYKESSLCDNLPITRNPERFDQFKEIDSPIYMFSGSNEDDLYKQFELLKGKALSAPGFTSEIIQNTGHTYKGSEEIVANKIFDWINKTLNN